MEDGWRFPILPNWVLEGLEISEVAGKTFWAQPEVRGRGPPCPEKMFSSGALRGKYVKVKEGPDWRALSVDKETLELKCLGDMYWSKFLSW